MLKALLVFLFTALTLSVVANGISLRLDTADTSESQVSVNAVDWPFHKLMHHFAQQTGRSYPETITGPLDLVTLTIGKTGLHNAMLLATKDRNLGFKITDKYILVFRREDSAANKPKEEKLIKLSGSVIDSASRKPVAGATVMIVNGKKTITKENGAFEINDVPLTGTLIISHVSYDKVKRRYTSGTVGVIRMTETRNQLEVIVTNGYTRTTQKENTGNIGTYKAADISVQPVSNPLMALQGRIPGLFIAQTSGIPGAALNVLIRGKNSMVNGNMPFIIINGAPYSIPSLTQTPVASMSFDPLANFNLDDIEQFDVLKDADASAIYGSRAANGIIYITTKQPQAGETKLGVNVYSGIGRVTGRIDLMNTEEYLRMRRQAFDNDRQTPENDDYDINGKWDTTRFTDWQKELIGGLAKITNARVSLSGGNALTQFRLSGVYRQEGTVYPGKFYNRMRSFRGDVNHRSQNQKLSVNFGAGYTYNTYLYPQRDLTSGIYSAPNAPAIHQVNGLLNWQDNTFNNPLAEALRQSTTVIDNLLGNLSVTYQLPGNILFKNSFGYNLTQLEDVAITPFSSWMPNTDDGENKRTNSTGVNVLRAWTWEPQLNYGYNLGPHRFQLITGATFQQSKGRKSLYLAQGFMSDDLLENPGAASHVEQSQDRTKYNYAAAFARLGYTLHDKYLLNLTARRDGSSRFGPEKSFGTFWAIGAAWIFSNERLLQDNIPFLNYGKLRGSFGVTGNDQIVDGRYLSLYDVDLGYYQEPGLSAQQLKNSSIGWETIYKSEVALELAASNGTTANISLYHHFSNNQLVQLALPGTTGFPSITANLPARVENTGIEFDVRHTLLKKTKIGWTTDFNITLSRNKLASFPDLALSPYMYRFAEGYSLDTKFLYQYDGVNKSNGLYMFREVKKDGTLKQYDRVPVSLTPSFYGGWNNSLRYGRLSMDVFFYFVRQKGYMPMGPGTPGTYLSTGSNQLAMNQQAWKQRGDDAPFQRLSTGGADVDAAQMRYLNSTELVQDASYIRLKNLSIAYTASPAWLRVFKISDAKIYLQAQNIITFTRYKGMDPETWQFGVGASMPPLRIISGGLQMTL